MKIRNLTEDLLITIDKDSKKVTIIKKNSEVICISFMSSGGVCVSNVITESNDLKKK